MARTRELVEIKEEDKQMERGDVAERNMGERESWGRGGGRRKVEEGGSIGGDKRILFYHLLACTRTCSCAGERERERERERYIYIYIYIYSLLPMRVIMSCGIIT